MNLCLKFDTNIFISDRYMVILLPCWFGSSPQKPHAHYGEVFWGGAGVWPLNVVRYHRDPQWHILSRKHTFWRIDRPNQSRNATWVHAEESKKRKKKETQRCDKSHMCPDHPHSATPTKVVAWGGVPNVVNYAKFHQNRYGVWLPTWGVEICLFLCLMLWLI